jgi:hypothetical protein
VYHGSLTDRSVTVTATCEMAGMVSENATMFVLCSLWQCLRRNATNRPFPGPSPRREGQGRFLSNRYDTFAHVNLGASDRVVRI